MGEISAFIPFLVGGGIQWSKKVTIWMCNIFFFLFLDKRIIKLIRNKKNRTITTILQNF